MVQEFRACDKGSIKKHLQRHGIGALVNVEVIRPGIRLIPGQHRECEQNGPPGEQRVKCLLITSDRGEYVSVVVAEIWARESTVDLSRVIDGFACLPARSPITSMGSTSGTDSPRRKATNWVIEAIPKTSIPSTSPASPAWRAGTITRVKPAC
jgi:hypothetical protein